jgi:hypothetical protein
LPRRAVREMMCMITRTDLDAVLFEADSVIAKRLEERRTVVSAVE